MKKNILLIPVWLLLAMVITLTSCEEDKVTDAYGYGIYELESSISAIGIVENYLEEKGCPYDEIKTFTSESTLENDNAAKALFKEAVAKIDETELAAKLNGEKIKFTYGVVRSSADPDANVNFLDKKEYIFE